MMSMTPRTLTQIVALTAIGVTSMPRRAGASAVAVVGIGGVVIVLVSILSIARGFQLTLARAGDPGTALVMRSGAQDEISSGLRREEVRIIKDASAFVRSEHASYVSAELVEMVTLPRTATATAANVTIRGLESSGVAMRGAVRIVEGRVFASGQREIVVGRAAQRQFSGLLIGRTVTWDDDEWVVTGVFEDGGTVAESEIWCDVAMLQSTFRKDGLVSAVRVRLASPDAFGRFRDALAHDPRLNVAIQRESDYYLQQSTATATLISTIGAGIVVLMTLGAVFCAVNAMHTAVATRAREIATLRALGFGTTAVVVSVLAESTLLALIGGALGALAAWSVFDGYETSTLNWQSFSQVVFAFSVTPSLLATGLASSVLIGTLGGILPAIRAARLPVASALREL